MSRFRLGRFAAFFLAVARVSVRLTVAARRLGADHATVSASDHGAGRCAQGKAFRASPAGLCIDGTRGAPALQGRGRSRRRRLPSPARSAVRISPCRARCVSARQTASAPCSSPRARPIWPSNIRISNCRSWPCHRLLSLSKREADIAISLAPPKEGKDRGAPPDGL